MVMRRLGISGNVWSNDQTWRLSMCTTTRFLMIATTILHLSTLTVAENKVSPSQTWGWLMVGGSWNTTKLSSGLPCSSYSCVRSGVDSNNYQLDTYRCRGLVWQDEQFFYNSTGSQELRMKTSTTGSYNGLLCVDVIPSGGGGGGDAIKLAACNKSALSQAWYFDTQQHTVYNGENLYMSVEEQGVNNYFNSSLRLMAAKNATSASKFSFVPNWALSRNPPDDPPWPPANYFEGVNASNFVRNGNFNETSGTSEYQRGDLTAICNWNILRDVDVQPVRVSAANVKVPSGSNYVQLNRKDRHGGISQVVSTIPLQSHALRFQATGLAKCGKNVNKLVVTLTPSSTPKTIVGINTSAQTEWQTQVIHFVPSGMYVNLTFTSASDLGLHCGPSITDIQISLLTSLALSPNVNTRVEVPMFRAKIIVALAVVAGVLFGSLLLVVFGALWFSRRASHRNKASMQEFIATNPVHAKKYDFDQIESITDGFKHCIGVGGFANVYKGEAPDGRVLAVKRAFKLSYNFYEEVDMLARVHHRRVVRFLGYCDDIREQILVFEYMEGGSLYECLHQRLEGSEPLTFEQRMRIAQDVALGLEYLHHGATPCIIHCDVKSANVLLTANLSAKISDFGTIVPAHEKTGYIGASIRNNFNKGTCGYIDPVCVDTLSISTKSDVYSFGVLLLELISGRKPLDDQGPFAGSMLADILSVCEWLDPLIRDGSDPTKLRLMIATAGLCLQPNREDRPTMLEVVKLLGRGDCSPQDSFSIATLSTTISTTESSDSLNLPTFDE